MDSNLKNALWSCIYVHYIGKLYPHGDKVKSKGFALHFLTEYLKLPIDSMGFSHVYARMKKEYIESPWYNVYDFIEFVVDNPIFTSKNFIKCINIALVKELSGYRFVGSNIYDITSETEIEAIEEALDVTTPFTPINDQLKKALDLYSDRENPSFRNSIKEAISAVETLCKLIVKDPKTSLGRALDKLESVGFHLHKDLREGFKKLYHYTSDSDGIRHGLMDEDKLSSEDAKFMLVSCSAFIKYLIVKAQKVGIKF